MTTKRVLNKKCNVDTKGEAIVTSSRRIVGTLKETYLTVGEIIQCLQRRAVVEEVLIDGSTLLLNRMNYDKDNNANLRGTQKVETISKPMESKKEAPPVDVVKDVLENIKNEVEEIINPLEISPVIEVEITEPVAKVEIITVPEVEEEEPVEEESVAVEEDTVAECPQQPEEEKEEA